jgi:propanol-preferring alcohol dehydrogenase
MHAMVLSAPRTPLEWTRVDDPQPGPGRVLVHVNACGVCRTDLHVADGELPLARYPIIPGHEIVGTVVALGNGVRAFAVGDRVGIPWLASTCGACRYCRSGQENLCDAAQFTGCTVPGGFAEFAAADQRYCFRLPSGFSDTELAPWLCAGLIGYRAFRMAGDGARIGVYGFGAAAHIVAQLLAYQRRELFAFTRRGDVAAQSFARALGAAWAGDSDETPPVELDAAILFAPAGELVPKALRDVAKGGIVVCAGIHMSDIPSFPYALLWSERRICSVANLTRRDGTDFIALAGRVPIRTSTTGFPLRRANEALDALRHGKFNGAAVLTMS